MMTSDKAREHLERLERAARTGALTQTEADFRDAVRTVIALRASLIRGRSLSGELGIGALLSTDAQAESEAEHRQDGQREAATEQAERDARYNAALGDGRN